VLPLERYQLDCLLEEKAQHLEAIVGHLIKPDSHDSGSYETDTGRAMGVNAGYPEWYTVACLLTVNKKKGVVKFRYSVSDDSDYWSDGDPYASLTSEMESEEISKEDFEYMEQQSRLWFQANNPDQLLLPLPPIQSCLRFLHPLDVPPTYIPMEIASWELFDIIVRYSARDDVWSIKTIGELDIDIAIERNLLVPLPCAKSGDRVEESVAFKYVRDLLEIVERERGRS
jgi:hypothetical protein